MLVRMTKPFYRRFLVSMCEGFLKKASVVPVVDFGSIFVKLEFAHIVDTFFSLTPA
jgi:hypothetical protein